MGIYHDLHCRILEEISRDFGSRLPCDGTVEHQTCQITGKIIGMEAVLNNKTTLRLRYCTSLRNNLAPNQIVDQFTPVCDDKAFFRQGFVVACDTGIGGAILIVAVNRGIGGDTTFGVWDRLDLSVFALEPKAVVMLIGVNNIDTMFERYEDIVKSLRENLPNSHIVLISLTSMGQNWGRNNHKAAFNNVKIKLIAERNGCTFVDMYTPLLNEETDEIYPEYTSDGGHLTAEGYQVFTDTVTPVLEKLLKK